MFVLLLLERIVIFLEWQVLFFAVEYDDCGNGIFGNVYGRKQGKVFCIVLGRGGVVVLERIGVEVYDLGFY